LRNFPLLAYVARVHNDARYIGVVEPVGTDVVDESVGAIGMAEAALDSSGTPFSDQVRSEVCRSVPIVWVHQVGEILA
jgi:hypothetical protein